MGEVVQFAPKLPFAGEHGDGELDLLTAVDVAIRDLADLMGHLVLDSAREQAEACRQMLVAAYDAALQRQ